MKDAVATVIVAAGAGLYAAHLATSGITFVGSARWMSATLFVAGIAACAVGSRAGAPATYANIMALGVVTAFAGLITTLVMGSEITLAVVAGVIGVMWLVTTVRHALGTETPDVSTRVLDGSHEALELVRHG